MKALPKQLKKLALLLLASSLLASCTATFTYNQLDWLIPWYVDGYVDLTRDQKRLLKGQLTPVLQWHRDEELLSYIDILNQIESDLAAPVSAAQVRGWIDEAFTAGQRVEETMMTVALNFGATLSDAQIQEFVDSLWEEQEEYEADFLERDDLENIEDNLENLEDFLRRFIGRPSPAQQKRLKLAAESMQRFDAAWLAEREDWLTTLELLLQRQPGWQDALRAAHARRTADRPPDYRAIVDHNLDVITGAVADVLNQMSPKQYQRAQKEIEDLRGKLRKLIRQSES